MQQQLIVTVPKAGQPAENCSKRAGGLFGFGATGSS